MIFIRGVSMRDLIPTPASWRRRAVRVAASPALTVLAALTFLGAPLAAAAGPAPQTAPIVAADADRAEAARLEAEAIALRDAGDLLEADLRVADLIPIELRLYGPDSDLLANSHGFRADLALQRHDPATAAGHLRAELAIRQRRQDVGGVASTSLRLVEALTRAGQSADAEAALIDAWGPFTRTFSPSLPMARDAVDGLVLALARSGNAPAASDLLSRLTTASEAQPVDTENWLITTGGRLVAAEPSGLGLADLGLDLLRQAVERRQARDAEPQWQAEAWGRLAEGQADVFDWAAAARSRRHALTLWERTRSREAQARESAYLGRALLEAGEEAEAYRLLTQARTAFRARAFAEADRAYVAVHLARAALATGRDEEGDRLSQEAMALRTSGPAADPDALRLVLEVRADLMIRRNRLDEAEALLGQARELALAHDPSGAAVSVIDSNLSGLRGLQGRNADAESLARASIEDVAARYGPRSPQLVVVLANLATQLSNAGQDDRALPLIRQAVDIQREVAAGLTEGPEVRQLLSMEYKLGRILGGTGASGESLTLLRSVHRRSERALGRSDVVTIDSGVQAGLLMMQAGELHEAEALLRKMALLAASTRGAESYDMIDVLQIHSAVLYALGRYDECLTVMRRVLAISDAAAPRWPRTRIDVMTNTAKTMMELDRNEEAVALLRRAGALALDRNMRAGAAGGGERAMSRQPFAVLVRAAWQGAQGA